ncbi:hypothetical protein Gpo141_00011287 [Globisporangium polare]
MTREDRRHPADDQDADSVTYIGSFERSVMARSSTSYHDEPISKGNSSVVPKSAAWYSSRVLGTWGVVAIIFLYGCGGSMGTGKIITAGGPLVGLITIAVYPLVMTVPYGYIIAELCSAFPHDGGFTLWVMHAFGPFWGFQVGYWSWLSGAMTCALVTDLVLKIVLYCGDFTVDSSLGTYLLKAAIALALTLPSLGGTKFTSRVCLVFLAVMLLPFVVFTVWTFAKFNTAKDFSQVRRTVTNATGGGSNDVITTGDVDIDWSSMINTLAWKFGGLNMASLFAGEVRDPSRVFARAIAVTVILSLVVILLPLVAAIGAHVLPWTDFDSPVIYMEIAPTIGSNFLDVIVVTSAVAAASGRYISCLYCTSFQISGMAEHDMMPAFFANKNNRFRTPQYAVLATFATVLPMQLISSEKIIAVCSGFACAVELLILFAAVKLRLKMPYIPRPVKMPGGIVVLVLSTLGPAAVLGYIVYNALVEASGRYMSITALVPGLLYGLYDLWDRRRNGDPFTIAASGLVITPAQQ